MLVYLHGFNSSARSVKATMLGDALALRGLSHRYASPTLPSWPPEAIAVVESVLAQHADEEICFVGSSLGGFYATWLAHRHKARAVLINPAIDPHERLVPYLGPQKNPYTGETFDLDQAHLNEWQKLCVNEIDPGRYLLLVETGDEVLDYREATRAYAGARQVVIKGGDHSMQSFPSHIPLILEFAGMAS